MEWRTMVIPACDTAGAPLLAALAKRTYTYGPGGVAAAQHQEPLVEADVYTDEGNPLYSDIAAESDLAPCKPYTDVVVTGAAHAPRGRTVYYLDCSVQVGALVKTVRVYGERRIRQRALGGLRFTDPTPFGMKELGYRFAFGGVARAKDGTLYPYPPNPIGCGMAFRDAVDDVSVICVPGQEDPACPLEPEAMLLRDYEQWTRAPRPVSLGWTRRTFYPRYTWAGVLPEYLSAAAANRDALRARYPSLAGVAAPKMDFRFYQGASDGLWGGPLKGDEAVRLRFLDPDYPTLEFVLPGERPAMVLDRGGKGVELTPALQSVVIDNARRLVTMVWRGGMAYGGVQDLAEGGAIRIRIER